MYTNDQNLIPGDGHSPHSIFAAHFQGPGGIRDLLAIAFPMVVSSATELVMIGTDRLFLARLGPVYIAANASGGLMAFMTMTFFFGLIGYTTALVAQHYGAGQPRRCPLVVHQGVLLGLVGYPIVLAIMPVAAWFMQRAGHDPVQQVLERQYYTILVLGSITGFLAAPIRGFFTGIGRTSVVMVSSMVAMCVNIAANYTLIFGKFGFPALGIRGAGYGTVLGHAFGVAVLFFVYLHPAYTREYGTYGALRFDRRSMARLLKYGTPSGTEFFLNMAAFNFFVQLFHGYGRDAAAAITITLQWDMVSFFPMLGVSMATTSLVGRFMGARTPDVAERAAYSGVKTAASYAGLLAVVYMLWPAPLVRVFSGGEESASYAAVFPLATQMLRLAALYVISDALAIVFGGALRGAGDTQWCMRVSVVMHWLMALCGYVMIRHTEATPTEVWVGFVGVVMAMGLVYYLRFRNGKWKRIRVLEDDEAELAGPPPPVPADVPEQVIE